MKRIVFIIGLFVLALGAFAQGYPITVTASEADTNKNAETDYINIPNVGGFKAQTNLTIQVLCTDDYGGTSDGTLTLEGSVDGTSYDNLAIDYYTDQIGDSITISDGKVAQWIIPKTYHYKYRVKAVGTSADTTLFTPTYRYQEPK